MLKWSKTSMMPHKPLQNAIRIKISDILVPMSVKHQKLHKFSAVKGTTVMYSFENYIWSDRLGMKS